MKTLIEHPNYALKEASSKFELNDKEKNIIVSHMFPVSLNLPMYAEIWIVDLVDDVVAIVYDACFFRQGQIKKVPSRIIVGSKETKQGLAS